MKFHLVTCAYVKAPSFLVGHPEGMNVDLPVRYGVIEHPDCGPIVVDGGYSPRMFDIKGSFLYEAYKKTLQIQFCKERSIEDVLSVLGYNADDVNHAVLTHLHADHVGFLDQLTKARFTLDKKAYHVRSARHGVFEELMPPRFSGRVNLISPRPGTLSDEHLCACEIFPDVYAVSLPGHGAGHMGLWLPKVGDGVLYAADAAWTHQELSGQRTAWLSKLVSHDVAENVRTKAWLSECDKQICLCHEPGTTSFDFSGEQ